MFEEMISICKCANQRKQIHHISQGNKCQTDWTSQLALTSNQIKKTEVKIVMSPCDEPLPSQRLKPVRQASTKITVDMLVPLVLRGSQQHPPGQWKYITCIHQHNTLFNDLVELLGQADFNHGQDDAKSAVASVVGTDSLTVLSKSDNAHTTFNTTNINELKLEALAIGPFGCTTSCHWCPCDQAKC
jgi:hypothetical protein